jgi:hypothetical protein
LIQTLSTKVNYPGDSFSARISEPVMVNGREVIPAGAILEGQVATVQRPGRVAGVGQMRLVAERIVLPSNQAIRLDATLQSAFGEKGVEVSGGEGLVKGPSSRKQTITEVAALGGGGALVGLIFAHPVAGLAVGGTIGFVHRMHKRGVDLNLPQGTLLSYQLTRDLGTEPATEQHLTRRIPSQQSR